MKKKSKEKIMKITLVIVMITSIFVMLNSYKKNQPLESIKINEEKVNKEMYAMYKKDSNGDYYEYKGDTFPINGYELNINESYCVDRNEQKVDGVLSVENNKPKVSSDKTVYCYLYYDPISYTITYNLNGGEQGSNEVISYNAESEITLPTPSKQCNNFGGWYEDSTYNGERIIEIEKGSYGNKTYYAKWNGYNDVYVSSNGNDTTGDGTKTKPVATINKAYACDDSNEFTIKLLTNLTQTSEASFNENKKITLTSNTGTNTITRGSSLTNGSIIYQTNGELTTTNITFDGNNVETTIPLLVGDNTDNKNVVMNLNSGTIIQKNLSTNSNLPSGASVIFGATMNVNGATIQNNIAKNGGGAGLHAHKSTIIINSGNIKSNETMGAVGYGGGIQVGQSTLTINGGTISNNSASTHGGGVYLSNNSTLTINGGIISNNNSEYGGGLALYSSTSIITDGNIINNTATLRGGGIAVSSTSLTINGGSIKNNNSEYGGGISVYGGTITMENGDINGNTSTVGGAGIALLLYSPTSQAVLYLKGGTIQNNISNGFAAGGVFNNSCSFYFQGGSIINNKSNASSGYGGILNANASGYPNYVYQKTGGTLSGNTPNDIN